jgi:hypothetical protein
VAAAAFVASPIARGQSAYACDEGEPFTARRAEHIVGHAPDGTEFKQDFGGRIARNSSGRVYSEQEIIRVKPSQKQMQDTGESAVHYGHPARRMTDFTIWISDCHSGKDVTLYPDLKIAWTSRDNSASLRKRSGGASLFEFLTSGPRPPNATFEDLGLKDIEGVLTHGYRITILGTQDDGEWNGRVRHVTESWISDDLEEIILQNITNVKTKVQTTISLTEIKREEPDPSLFEIPPGYKIDPMTPERHPADAKPE